MIFLLEKIRKIFKSIGKKEETINDLITYKKFKKNLKRYNINFQKFNPELNVKKSIKMVAVISFFFDRKKIKN